MPATLHQPFPAFELPDASGTIVTNETLKGQPAIVYFYPKDDTSGCTLEANEFQSQSGSLEGIKIVGVSPDSCASHTKFAKKYGLGFTLLADTERKLAEALGIWVEKSMYGKKYMGIERTTYLLDADGNIVEIWNKVKPAGHAEEVAVKAKALLGK